MAGRRQVQFACLLAWFACGIACADPVWLVDPGQPGSDRPPQGRSLFDHLTSRNGRQVVPFPFTELLASLEKRLAVDGAYLDRPVKKVMIPLGRSLQRDAAAPRFFDSPRVVVAVDSEPRDLPGESGMLLRDRLFIAYLEAADVLEIISYNEDAARFEFQVVSDYRQGGTPRVRYARRTVCTACHQNAAPIFARPLWDETNANGDIAKLLAETGREFYGLPASVGVDVAYAIDNATDRANGLALTQALWEQGCGDGAVGARCRAAVLVQAIQFALSGRRGFAQPAGDDLRAAQSRLRTGLSQHWPEGLLLPGADIPNRIPLAGVLRQTAAGQALPDRELARLADVAARFEPLAPRPAKAVWRPDPDGAVRRAATGVAEFLSASDIRRIDDHLARAEAGTSLVAATCTIAYRQQAAQSRMKLDCDGPGLKLRGILYVADADRSVSGRLRNVHVNDDALGGLVAGGHSDAQGTLHIRLTRGELPGRVRLSDGDAVTGLRILPEDGRADRVRVELQIRHDFRHLERAIDRLANDMDGPLPAGPFVRSHVLGGLFDALGTDRITWCCSGDAGLPPPTAERPETINGDPLLAPFLQVCAACHRSHERFPPNFLAGPPDQVQRGVAQCAERIRYRLAMWNVERGHRLKSPMPPRQTVGLGDGELETWTKGPLRQLRNALYEIAARESMPLSEHDQATSRTYAELRPCLPTS